jgi:DNA-binding MarR family transcriptional regulator
MSAARQTLRNLLMSRHELLYDRAFATAADYGYGDVTPAMARLFVQVARGPIGISELARRLAISRQSVHETVSIACDLGLVELVDDPADRRVRIVQFTESGKRMSRAVLAVDRRMERELARRIGARNVATLKRLLSLDWGSDERTAG